MSNLTFDIISSRDFFTKLSEEYDEFVKNKTSSRVALNCAMTSWHLVEWIYHEYQGKIGTIDLFKFQSELKSKCTSLQIMHDLANGTKHFKLSRHKPQVSSTELKKGSYSSDYSRSYDISSLRIEMNDGRILYFEDELLNTINFWNEYLNFID